MKISAEGGLRHMFHGTYAAGIGLHFTSQLKRDAAHKLPWLSSWEATKTGLGLTKCMERTELEVLKLELAKHNLVISAHPLTGSPMSGGIDSCDYSIDFGPPFTIELEIPLAD